MAQFFFANSTEVLPGAEHGPVVVGGLHSLTAVVRILNQLVESGGHGVPGFFLLVPSLQQRQQIRVPVADKLVAQKMGDLKIVKVSLAH